MNSLCRQMAPTLRYDVRAHEPEVATVYRRGLCAQVYTVGPDYAHAEARKSPALDGRVERDQNGKEIRYPVILSAKEKLIARKVCMAFKVITALLFLVFLINGLNNQEFFHV